MIEQNLKKRLEEIVSPLKDVSMGDYVVVKIDNDFCLINYEKNFEEVLDYFIESFEYAFIDRVFKISDPSVSSNSTGSVTIFGKSMISFKMDEELGLHLPRSNYQAVEINFDEKYSGDIEIISGLDNILETLSDVVSENYLQSVIVPYVNGENTNYKFPHESQFNKLVQNSLLRKFKKDEWSKFDSFLDDVEIGNKIYIGYNNAIWMVTKSNEEDSEVFSKKYNNAIFVKNSFLGGDNINTLVNDKEFVLPSCERREGINNSIKRTMKSGIPQIITRNKQYALNHFQTTCFSEFIDIVDNYMN